jgi:pheromone shutdown protein TraB
LATFFSGFLVTRESLSEAEMPKHSANNSLSSDNYQSVSRLYNKITGRIVVIVGTMHTSQDSVQLVKNTIRSVQPDTVVLELDSKRIGYSVSTRSHNIREASMFHSSDKIELYQQRKLIKQPVIDRNLIKARTNTLSTMGKPLSQVFRSLRSVGFTSGSEFKAAIKEAFTLGATIALGDRDIDITLRRLSEAVSATESDRYKVHIVSHKCLICVVHRFDAMVVGIALLLNPWRQEDGTPPAQPFSSLTASLDRALANPLLVRQIVEVVRKEVPAVYQALIGEERMLHICDFCTCSIRLFDHV